MATANTFVYTSVGYGMGWGPIWAHTGPQSPYGTPPHDGLNMDVNESVRGEQCLSSVTRVFQTTLKARGEMGDI